MIGRRICRGLLFSLRNTRKLETRTLCLNFSANKRAQSVIQMHGPIINYYPSTGTRSIVRYGLCRHLLLRGYIYYSASFSDPKIYLSTVKPVWPVSLSTRVAKCDALACAIRTSYSRLLIVQREIITAALSQ